MSFLTTLRRRQQTIQSLARKGYREAYVEQHIKRGLATQIRMMREDRQWTQAELAGRINTGQPSVARLEDEDYGQFTLQTLKKLASAFDVALVVRFVPFSQLVQYTSSIGPADLSPVSFEQDSNLRITDFPAAVSTAPTSVSTASSPRQRDLLRRSSAQLPFDFGSLEIKPIDAYRRVSTAPRAEPETQLRAAGGYR